MSEMIQAARQGRDIMVGGGQYRSPKDPQGDHFALSVVDLENKTHRLIELTFLAHGVALDPRRPGRIAVCEKIGPGAAMIDLERFEVVSPIGTTDDRLFYGHCAFSRDGSRLYATETYKDTSEGAIVIRDAYTLEVIGEFPSFGANPHECLLIDDGKTMVVTNGGGDQYGSTPNVAYIDVEKQTLLRQETLTNRALNTGHLAIAEDGSLVVVSAPRLGAKDPLIGGVSIQPHGKKMRSLSSPKKVVSQMFGEALSVMIREQRAVVTHPDGEMVTFWEIPNRHFTKSLKLPKPRGVSMTGDGSRYVISFGQDASLVQVDAQTLEPINDSLHRGSFITGSHLYNWSELARPLLRDAPREAPRENPTELPLERLQTLMQQAVFGFLATTDGERPTVRPMIAWTWADGELWCATGADSDKCLDIGSHPRVEYCFMNSDMQHARIEGPCRVDASLPAKQRFLALRPELEDHFGAADSPYWVVLRLDVSAARMTRHSYSDYGPVRLDPAAGAPH